MSALEVLCFVETGWPEGRTRKRGEGILTGMEWKQTVAMPMLPRKGDWIAIGEDDFRRVDDVYITLKRDPANPEAAQYEVHFEFEEEVRHAAMTAAGWEEA